MKWLNAVHVGFWLDRKHKKVLDRESMRHHLKPLGRVIKGDLVRNTRRVRKILRLAKLRREQHLQQEARYAR